MHGNCLKSCTKMLEKYIFFEIFLYTPLDKTAFIDYN